MKVTSIVSTSILGRQYGPLQPPQCGYSNVSHAEVHSDVPAKRDAWPWAVALGYNSSVEMSGLKWRCTATLISSRHVLTGAVRASHPDLKVARIGALNLGGDDDDHVRPNCLPLTNALQSKNLSGSYAAGWGSFADFLSYSVVLVEVQVRVDSDETCREAYSSYNNIVIDNRVLCVASINAGFYQIGFVSYGITGSEKPRAPCVYTSQCIHGLRYFGAEII